jgi:predicted AlkP superfamily phosphohydrolase/phosphomutase
VTRPRIRFLGLALVASAFLLTACRRPQPPAERRAAAVEAPPVEADDPPSRERRAGSGSHPVIWIGLDGLDWEIVDRLSAEGKMPHWKRLVAEGWSGRIRSFMPVLSPIVWTTVATGVGPDVHRVLDFQEVDPKTGVKIPISGSSRAVPAIWNLASAAGRKVGVVGWWATHPAEEVNGFFVSDHASPILYDKLPLSGVAFPSSLDSGIAQVVARDGRITAEDLSRFVDVPPGEIAAALASGQGMENRIVALSRILSATRVYQRAARDLYDRNHPDLTMLYLEGTDEIGHVFAPFAPPRLGCVSDEDFRRYQGAVAAYYEVVDRMLGQWMRRAAEDGATLLVQSDHGFKWGADRSCERSSLNWSTAAFWHRLDGVFAAWGARVRPGKARATPEMADSAPTVLALLGLPADRRMPGRPIPAFGELPAAPKKDLFVSVAVRRVAAAPIDARQSSEYAKKLLALGYLSPSETKPLAPTGGDRPGMTEGAWNNLGLYERESVKNLAAAKAAFEKALALSPGYHSPMFNLAILERSQGHDPRARDWLFRSFDAGHADPEGTLHGWLNWYADAGKSAAARDLLEEAVRRYPQSEAYARALAIARFRRKDCTGGLAVLGAFEAKTSDPDTLNSLALLNTCIGKREDAIGLLKRSLAIRPDQPGAIQSLNILQGTGRPTGSP